MSETSTKPPVRCRSCGAAIVWLRTKIGKAMPVDAETVQDAGAQQFEPAAGHISHFATCPQAGEHRKPR